ncbi:hypothetical protein IKG05_00075 [Candidatus Saccharibacteria bacterium]|nr:hypothetical protein [Candidatus Saccharibacteria bacterium]
MEANMIEYYSTVKEDGIGKAMATARELEERGYEVLDIHEGMIPRGENADGKVYYVPGYQIVAESGSSPHYRGYLYNKMRSEQSNGGAVSGLDASWLW